MASNMITVVQADKARNLKLTCYQVSRLEEEYKKGLVHIIEDISHKIEDLSITTKEIVRLLYAEMAWEDKNISMEETYNVFDCMVENLGGVYQSVDPILRCAMNYLGFDNKTLDKLSAEEQEKLKKNKKTK